MGSQNDGAEQPSFRFDLVTAVVYAVLLISCTIVVQELVHGYLDQYSRYVGVFVVSLFTFFFAAFFGSVGKSIINFVMRKRFLSKRFVILAIVFTVLVCFLCSGILMFWWASAIMGSLGIVITFFKVLFRRELRKNISRVREVESDLRHQSLDRAEHVFDRIFGRR